MAEENGNGKTRAAGKQIISQKLVKLFFNENGNPEREN